MKAMILAAGRGERLRPLTDTTPKPLLQIGDRRLIEYHLDALARAGIVDVVINTAWLGDQIRQCLGSGDRYGLSIQYSDEGEQALETAGGIIRALPLLGDAAFIVVNGDIHCDYDFSRLLNLDVDSEAHLVLVDNPAHHPDGDFALENGQLRNSGAGMLTYSGIGLYTAELFRGLETGVLPLAPILRQKIEHNRISGERHAGHWTDVGTLDRLQTLRNTL